MISVHWDNNQSDSLLPITNARLSKILLKRRNTKTLGTLKKEDGTYTVTPEQTLNHLADDLLGKETKVNIEPTKQYQRQKQQEKQNISKYINLERLQKNTWTG